jgi:UDP-glucose 4-epimerase/UDP-glucuronate decarboxylase
MRALVTGAAGVIGFELSRALLARGDEVVAVDVGLKGGLDELRQLAARHGERLELHEVDLCRPHAALDASYDAVFHLAAIVGVRYVSEHPWRTIRDNLLSTLQVLEACGPRAGVVLFASSSENYASGVDQGFVPVPTPEDVTLAIGDIALPRWSYAASKLAGESAVFSAARELSFAPVVIRFHNVYGPRMGPTHVIPEFLERCRAKADPFPVFGPEQTRSFLHVEDAARAVLAVCDAVRAERSRAGIWNVGSERETVIADLAQAVFDVTGHHPRVDARPAPPGSVARRVPDVRKLAALGFRPRVALEDGLRDCWNAQRATPRS